MSIPPERIVEAAARGGFDSELRVASMLANAKWQVNQSVYFIDKDEGKGRELDIEAYRIFNATASKPEATCLIQLLIEVKKTKDPFLFFSSERGIVEAGAGYGVFHWKNNISHGYLSYRDIDRHKPLAAPLRFARAYSSFKDSKTQQIAAGVLSAFKAAVHYKEECDEKYSDTSSDIAFFIPIVVVDGEIYDCYIDSATSELTSEPVDALVYRQNYHSNAYGRLSNRVNIIRASALPQYIDMYRTWGEDIVATIKKNQEHSQK
jgi:hypothetical protein